MGLSLGVELLFLNLYIIMGHSIKRVSTLNSLASCMSRKGPTVDQGMLDFVEDLRYVVVSH